jgi:hypothetical protein
MNGSGRFQPVICPHCHERIDNQKITIKSSKIVIVEGRDEEGFFEAFLKTLGLAEIQVAGIGGKTQIRPNLKALVKDPDFSKIVSIGIIRDANADPKAAFQSVRDALKSAGLPIPRLPMKLVAGQEDPAISVGLSAQKGFWDFKNAAFLKVKIFLLSM